MKKSLFTIVVLLLLGLNVQAQIQRNFWGLELGRSTKEDVKMFLKTRGLTYNQDLGGFDVIAVESEEGIGFGGYSWTPSFRFYNNILAQVDLLQFHIAITASGDYYDVDTKFMFYNLRSKLGNKYGSLEDPLNNSPQTHYVRRDNQTVVDLMLDAENNLVLSYYDRQLTRAAQSGNDL